MAPSTGYFHPQLVRQYLILTVLSFSFFGYFIGIALVITKLVKGGNLWYISLLFVIGVVTIAIQGSLWMILVMSDYIWQLPIFQAMRRQWHLPQKKARFLWLWYKYGAQRPIYSQLDVARRQIRLVTILPGQPEDEIFCTLEHADLDQKGLEYEALSYTWGVDYSPRHIVLNKSAFAVTPNLFGALKHLRFTDGERVVWIDAICIDQSNFAERGQQVSLMRDVYSRAASTVIWLGDETRERDSAMQLLSSAKSSPVPHDWYLERLQSHFQVEQSQWKAVLELFKMDYWNRVWIVQETAISATLTVACGKHSIPWDLAVAAQAAWADFRGIVTAKPLQIAIDDMEDMTTGAGAVTSINIGPKNNGPMSLSLNRDNIATTGTSFVHLLRDNWTALATDPRDKIYALIGIAADCQAPRLEADYSLSQFSAYLTTMKFLLENYGNLDLISYSDMHLLPVPRSFYRVPSWIPTFYWAWEASTTAASSQYTFRTASPPFAASGARKAIAEFVPQYKPYDHYLGIHRVILRAKICRIDRISQWLFRPSLTRRAGAVNPYLTRLKHQLHIATDWLPPALFSGVSQDGEDRDLVDDIRTLHQYFVLGRRVDDDHSAPPPAISASELARREDVLWRTLVYNRTLDGAHAPASWAVLFAVIIHGPSALPSASKEPLSSAAAAAATTPAAASDVDTESQRLMHDPRAREFIQPLLRTVRNLKLGKRFLFETDAGRIGIANPMVEPGDAVAVLWGCAMPMAMKIVGKVCVPDELGRERERERRRGALCGSVYLHEFMYGGAVQEVEAGRLGEEWFDFA